MNRLSLTNVGKRYGSSVAVQDVTMSLAEGEFVSLLGPSGCGKTTTLRMIAGFIRPSSGEITMNGTLLSSTTHSVPPEKRGMSMIFQSYALWPNMSVAENVAFGLKLRKIPAAEVKARVDRILSAVKLGHLRDRYPAELSGGQQQRVALARAIVIEPAVLLLDEPLSNLDASLREEMRSEIRRLHDAFRITTVYVTHDQAEAMVISDRIVVMNQGRIEQVDDPVSLYSRPRTRFVASFVGRTNFLDGEVHGSEIRFGNVSVAASLIAPAAAPSRLMSFCLRPQHIAMHAMPPVDGAGKWWVEATVLERAFLGERWDYVVGPTTSVLQWRASTSQAKVFEVGATVWLEIDLSRLSPLPAAADATRPDTEKAP